MRINYVVKGGVVCAVAALLFSCASVPSSSKKHHSDFKPYAFQPQNTGEPINMQKLSATLYTSKGYLSEIDFANIYFNQFSDLRQLLGSKKNDVATLNLSGNFSSSVTDTFPQHAFRYVGFMAVLSDKHNKITTLNLDNNSLNSFSAEVLAKLITNKNNKLHTLSLQNNLIGNEGAMALAEAFRSKNCQLKSVNLSRNTFNDDALAILERAAKAKGINLTVSESA